MAGSKGGRGGQGGGGNLTIATSATDQGGNTIDLTGFPLKYGEKDSAVSGAARQNIDKWEAQRVKNRIEYSYMTDPNGDPVGEVKGGKTSVSTPVWMKNKAKVFTHIHPRDKNSQGYLGGTFSEQDLTNWSTRAPNIETYRAAAAEGTYSISKGSNFDANGFSSFANGEFKKPYTDYATYMKGLNNDLHKGNVSWTDYSKMARDAFNKCMVEKHDMLIANQKKYGYKYTLERR